MKNNVKREHCCVDVASPKLRLMLDMTLSVVLPSGPEGAAPALDK